MFVADVEPPRVLIHRCVAESCILTLDANGVVGRYLTLIDCEVRVGGILDKWGLERCRRKSWRCERLKPIVHLHLCDGD